MAAVRVTAESTRAAGYSFAAVSTILDVPDTKLRYWAQIGFVGPSQREGTRQLYTFRDLVMVKAAKELIGRGFAPAEIRDTLLAARKSLQACESDTAVMAKLRIAFDGTALVVQDGDAAFEASGQRVFDFGVAELAEMAHVRLSGGGGTVAPLVRASDSPRRSTGKRPSAYDWFVEGLSVDGVPGKEDEAIACYRQALAADPGLAAAHTNLGSIAYRRGDRSGARAAFERALAIDPEQSESRFNLANIFFEDGETEVAAAELRRVLQSMPDFADAHYNLASALETLGGRLQAREHLQAFLRLTHAPADDPWVEEAKRRLASFNG
jgi:tetratricopeptide (TPR) repeat protein